MRSGNVLWFLTALTLLLLCGVGRAEPPSARVALALSLPVAAVDPAKCVCDEEFKYGCVCGGAGGCADAANCPALKTAKSPIQQAIDRAVARRLQYNPPAPLLASPQRATFPTRFVGAGAGGCSSRGG